MGASSIDWYKVSMSRNQPKILMNITHGFQARMLLRTNTRTRLLASGAKIAIVSENADETYFKEEFSSSETELVTASAKVRRIEGAIVSLRQYFLMNPALGLTLNSKRETFLRTASSLKRWIVDYGNMLFGSIPALRNAYLWFESIVFSGREFDGLLERIRPNLIVTGTPGFNTSDAHMIRAAKRAGIPSTTVMLSWDNLTSKGYVGAQPNSLLVWSELMAQEATELHDVSSDTIHLTGAAQFDHYSNQMDAGAIAEWRRENRIPSKSKLIVYGTINPKILPHEQSIVEELIAALQSNSVGYDYFFWVRLHPQMVKGPFAVNVDALLNLHGKNVHIEVPEVQSQKLSWDMPAKDSVHLRNLLNAADVLVTTCSTLVIDAACVDTPIINVFYDGKNYVDDGFSAKRFRDYTHYKHVLETGGIAVINSIPEFVEQVDQYIDNPKIDSNGRKRMLSQQLGMFDGNAGVRTADTLFALATT